MNKTQAEKISFQLFKIELILASILGCIIGKML
jgi:hypothetical protein